MAGRFISRPARPPSGELVERNGPVILSQPLSSFGVAVWHPTALNCREQKACAPIPIAKFSSATASRFAKGSTVESINCKSRKLNVEHQKADRSSGTCW
jgi:hypothetical protein